MSEQKLKRTMIVIQENGEHGGKGYNVTFEGDTDRIGTVPDEDLTPAEFYGSKLFQICTNVLNDIGAVKNVFKKQ